MHNYDYDQYALFVIGKCAFGLPFKWSDPPTAPDGTLSLQEALRLSTDNFILMRLTPNWAFKLPIERYAHFALTWPLTSIPRSVST